MNDTLTITQTSLENQQVSLTITVRPDRVDQAMRQAARQLASRGRVPGFRPGKAPYHVILRHYGREALLSEAAEALFPLVYNEAIAEEKITPYAQPNLEKVEMEPLSFQVTVPLMPEVDLKNYRDIRVPWEAPEITEAQVDEALERLRQQQTNVQEVDRPAGYGDVIIVDIIGKVGEETLIDQREFEHIPNNEEGGFIPGFDAAFVGKAAGDEWEFDLTYPEGSSSRWRGQTAHFRAKVLAVKTRTSPVLDDIFARQVGDFETLDALRQAIRAELETQALRQAESEYNEKVVEALAEQAEVAYPPVLLEEAIDDLIQERDNQLRRQGSSLEAYLQLNRMEKSVYREQLRPQAERRARVGLALGQLARLEGIEVTDEDVDEYLAAMAASLDSETKEGLRSLFQSPEFRRYARNELLTSRALARLRAIARGEVDTETSSEMTTAAQEIDTTIEAEIASGETTTTEEAVT